MPEGDRVRADKLEVSVTDAEGRPARVRGLAVWLVSVAPARAHGQVTVALVHDSLMRTLNRRFAGSNRVTDVLSFPAQPASPPGAAPRAARGVARSRPQMLGDIVIATGRAARQAREARHPVQTELRVLALHGLLHLLGCDHHADGGTMARLERRLRRRGGLREGLIERGTSS
jgi:probable rRNA maturation factor